MRDARVQKLLTQALAARARRDLRGASTALATARTLAPGDADVLHIAGIVAHERGGSAQGLSLIEQALAARPGDARIHRSRGIVALALQQTDVARESLRIALDGQPADTALARQVADLLVRAGDTLAAATLLERSALAAGDAGLDFAAGNLMQGLGRFEDASRAFARAAARTPADVATLSNLASALARCGRHDEAGQAFERASRLTVGPADGARLAHAYGLFRQARAEIDAAARLFETAVALQPDDPAYRRTLAAFLLTRRDAPMDAVWHLTRALEVDPAAFDDSPPQDIPAVLMSLLYVVPDPARQHRLASRWARAVAPPVPAPAPQGPRDRRLRIAYVSADFRDHAVANFILPILQRHDRAGFEIVAYAHVERPDAVTGLCRAACDAWHDVGALDDDGLASQVRADGIDVLVDLMGHTGGSRPGLFARRPATVQATYLGYPGTTGMTCFDARFVDAVSDPPGLTDPAFSEPLLRLESPFLAYRPVEPPAGLVPEPPLRRNGHATFGCFNNAAKITRPMLSIWARLLRDVPGSRLRLKSAATDNPAIAADLRRLAKSVGMPMDRLDIVPSVAGRQAHLASYGEVDIALDCFPYNGTTTTCEALGCGVPVVTLAGDTHVSRVSASLLTHAGLGAFVAGDPDAYVAIARRLAADAAALDTWRQALPDRFGRAQAEAVARVTTAIESAYRELWRRRCDLAGVG
ncbi:MAG: hypothetical protein JNK67_27615 [Alphaproteobacteria bacterium]|nr:hypothetical protein [Alphaproteobacteria bacterium]